MSLLLKRNRFLRCLTEVSNELGSVFGLYLCLFEMQDLRNGSSVFSDFLHGVKSHKVRKVADPEC